jgi:transcriptional regulator with XRE-family HTH domain
LPNKPIHITEIPERLAELRRALGLNQRDFAGRLGISQKTAQRSEADERELTASDLLAIREMGGNIDWVLSGEGQMIRAADKGFDDTPNPLAGTPPMTTLPVDEVQRLYRRTRLEVDEAIKLGRYRPPRVSEEAIVTLLFSLALRGGAQPSPADLVEFMTTLKQDLERKQPG